MESVTRDAICTQQRGGWLLLRRLLWPCTCVFTFLELVGMPIFGALESMSPGKDVEMNALQVCRAETSIFSFF